MPFWPLALYASPALGKALLEPIFKYTASGLYPCVLSSLLTSSNPRHRNKYAVHDLGTHYPNATGHNDGKDEPMPLEESGNMLIMTLSYVQKTGDQSLINTYVRPPPLLPSSLLLTLRAKIV